MYISKKYSYNVSVKKKSITLVTEVVEDLEKQLIIYYASVSQSTILILKNLFKQSGYNVLSTTHYTAKYSDHQVLYINTQPKNSKDWHIITKQTNTFIPNVRKTYVVEEYQISTELHNIYTYFTKSKYSEDQIVSAKLIEKIPTKSVQVVKKVRGNTKLFITIVLFVLALQVAFLPLLGISGYTFYYSVKKHSIVLNTLSAITEDLAIHTYTLVKPFYVSFSPQTSLKIDNVFNTLSASKKITQIRNDVEKNLFDLQNPSINYSQKDVIFNTLEKDSSELIIQSDILYKQLSQIGFINQETKDSLSNLNTALQKLGKFLPQIRYLFGMSGEKTYVLLFANNMELRPGGGFIGSFAIVKVSNATITSFDTYDVYDADGQLKERIAPPSPISDYLNQPYFYLRDSAWNADFPTNANIAADFLQKQIQLNKVDGIVLITTSAIQKIFEAFPEGVYIPEYKDRIYASNFYLKTQIASEKDFFPGSTQKKSYIQSVIRNTLLSLSNAQKDILLESLIQSLDEKFITLYSPHAPLQAIIDTLNFGGNVAIAKCIDLRSCIADSVLTTDANLGVNKANFFVKRSLKQIINIHEDGSIFDSLELELTNNSPNNIYPGGDYKNYLQFTLPKNTSVQKVIVNNQELVDYRLESDEFHNLVGLLVNVPISQSIVIKIEYSHTQVFDDQKSYQLIVQKQIGALNYPYTLSVILPKNIILKNKNFPALVTNNSLVYNTVLASDKLLLIELQKN